MQFIPLFVLLLAQQPSATTDIVREIQRLEELVAAGVIAPARLLEARQKLADAEDAEILNRTLYGKLALEEFTEEHSRSMIAAAERRAARLKDKVAKQQQLVEAEAVARTEGSDLVAELEARQAVVELARSRAQLFEDLVGMANAEHAAVSFSPSTVLGPSPVVEHFQGGGKFEDSDLKHIVLEFEKEFSKPLPVSARGETVTHKLLGFDHRGRVDVALSPDSVEGQWIRKFLTANQIPYIAFRRQIAGQATAAHIHIGPPSPRLTSAD